MQAVSVDYSTTVGFEETLDTSGGVCNIQFGILKNWIIILKDFFWLKVKMISLTKDLIYNLQSLPCVPLIQPKSVMVAPTLFHRMVIKCCQGPGFNSLATDTFLLN